MKKALALLTLTLAWLTLPAPAHAGCCGCCPPYRVDAGFNWYFRVYPLCGGGCMAGPWYSYFPYEAYFNAPAPVNCYPFWPPQSATAGAAPGAPPGTGAISFGAEPTAYGSAAPGYWAGH